MSCATNFRSCAKSTDVSYTSSNVRNALMYMKNLEFQVPEVEEGVGGSDLFDSCVMASDAADEQEGGGGWTRRGTAAGSEQNPSAAQQEDQAMDGGEDGGGSGGEEEQEEKEEVLEGIASLALFPSGSLSGHFLHTASFTCLGLFGTEIACERECSRGEDYRLLNLTIVNFRTKKETTVVVERKGEDAARLSTTCDLHGWDEEVVTETNNRHRSGETSPVITFECETLKADTEAEEHVKKFLPALVGRDAVGLKVVGVAGAVNIGRMTIKGLSLSVKETRRENKVVSQVTRASKRSLEESLRIVFGEVDAGISSVISTDTAFKRRVVSSGSCLSTEESQEQGFMRPTPGPHPPCNWDHDF